MSVLEALQTEDLQAASDRRARYWDLVRQLAVNEDAVSAKDARAIVEAAGRTARDLSGDVSHVRRIAEQNAIVAEGAAAEADEVRARAEIARLDSELQIAQQSHADAVREQQLVIDEVIRKKALAGEARNWLFRNPLDTEGRLTAVRKELRDAEGKFHVSLRGDENVMQRIDSARQRENKILTEMSNQ